MHTGARLAVASEWAASHRAELSALEGAFLSASQDHERQQKADEAEKNRRLAEAERQRAAEAEAAAVHQKKLRQRFQIAAAVGLLLALAAGSQTWRANRASEAATTKEKLANSRQLAALSASERNKRLDRSLLLAVEALRTENTFEARDSLFKALHDRSELRTFLHIEEGAVRGVAFSPDGKTIAAGYGGGWGGDGGVVLWDVAARKRLADDPLPVKEGDVRGVAFSPDGKTIAAGYSVVGGGSGVVLWDVAARKRLADDPLPVKEGRVSGVAFSPDGKTIAAGYGGVGGGYGGGGVVLWDVAARKRLADDPLPVKDGDVSGVAFSPDGKTIAAGYRFVVGVGGVVLWDVAARKRLADDPLPVKEGYVSGVAFSPDGKTIAAGYGGGVGGVGVGGVVLWDVAARKRLADDPLPVKEGYVSGVAFSPDGKTIAAEYGVGGVSGVVLWNVDLESWQRIAGRIANRNFTRDEWRQYFPDKPYRLTFPDLPVPLEVPSQEGQRRR